MSHIHEFFLCLPLFAFAVAVLLFVRTCRLSVRAQVLWSLALLICYSKFVVFRWFGGNMFYPEFPEQAVWACCLAYAFAAALTVLGVLVCWWRTRIKAFALPLVSAAIAIWGFWCGVRIPDVREIELSYPNLPEELDGYRIVQISDLHASTGARAWRTRAVVELANSLEADLVCLTGDYSDGNEATVAPFIEPIRNLRAKDGVWAITGNHEYFRNIGSWVARYREWGIRLLANECVFPRKSLALGGVNDFCASRMKRANASSSLESLFPDVGRAFAAATNGEFRVLLQHQPRMAHANLEAHHVDLQLSGHTHGGIMPIMWPVVRWKNNGFLSGLYRFGSRYAYVNSGAGQWAGFPLRFFTPSEVALITLRRAGSAR